MATITMDTSEYEQMKEVKTLLEQSLKRERASAKEIASLKQTQIEDLENNSKKVTIKTTNSTFETKSVLISAYELKQQIQFLGTMYDNRHGDRRYDFTDISYAKEVMDRIFKSHTHTVVGETTRSYEGLDEYISKIKEDYFNDQSKREKKMLEKAEEAITENSKLTAENKLARRMADTYKNESDEAILKFKDLEANLREFFTEMRDLTHSSNNVFNNIEYKTNLVKFFLEEEARLNH